MKNILAGLSLVFGLTLISVDAHAQDSVQLERRVQSIGTLIESSSAARQIESSGVAEARVAITVFAARPARLRRLGGPGATAAQPPLLTSTLAVQVADSYGNPVSKVDVDVQVLEAPKVRTSYRIVPAAPVLPANAASSAPPLS